MNNGSPDLYGTGIVSKLWDMMKESTLQMGTEKMIPRQVIHKSFMVSFPDRIDWERGPIPVKKGGLIWYTDGSKTNEDIGARVYGHGMKQRFSFSLGCYTTVFPAEVLYMLLKHVLMRILKRTIGKETFIVSLTVRLQSKPLDNCRIG
jgi:hypothetical protein